MERERKLEKMSMREGYREKSGGQASRRLTGPTTNHDERQGRRFDADVKWNTEEDLSYPRRDEHNARSSIHEEVEDEDEEENGTLLFNVTSVQANLSDVYPPAWMRYNLSFFIYFLFLLFKNTDGAAACTPP